MEVKNVGTFLVMLVKMVTPPLPPQTKLNYEQNGWKWLLFLEAKLQGGGGGMGDDGKNPEPIKQLSLGAES